jgi:alpha-amylase/alpha-mannosidase (GH57 family)
MASMGDLCALVNQAIDHAFYQEKYTLNFSEYLNDEKFKQVEVKLFIDSSLGTAIHDQIEEMDLYLNGGSEAAFVREAYNWLGKPRARKIRDYLNKILEDAKTYEQSKRRGRKPGSKNKKKPETSTK